MSSSEEATLNAIMARTGLKGANKAIQSSLILQGGLLTVFILLFIFLKPRVKWLYAPNIIGKPSHPCFGYDGYLNWLIPLFTISDSTLLVLIGLDSFMMLQTILLMVKIFFILCLTVVPGYCYLYWVVKDVKKDPNMELLERLSLESLDKGSRYYYLVPAGVYAISFFIYYIIYIYYKRYTVLRQLYLRDPSIMTSIMTLKRLSDALNSAEAATDYLGLPSRTVLVSKIPTFIKNDAELKVFFENMQIGEIESASLIVDTLKLRSLYLEKEEIIENIEKEVNMFINKMNKWSIQNMNDCSESIKDFKDSIANTIDNSEIDGKMSDENRLRIFNIFKEKDDKFKTYYKNNIKAIDFYFDALRQIYEKIQTEKDRLHVEHNEVPEDPHVIDIEDQRNALFIQGGIDRDASFFSLHHLFNLSRYSDYFTLDIPFGLKKGFVIFKDFKAAGVVKQTKLGSRIFSVEAENAPAPNDISWSNINNNSAINYFFKAWGNFLFFLFNILFTFIVVNVIASVNLDKFNQDGFFIKFLEANPVLKQLYEGSIAPLVYNLLLIIVPIIIIALVNMEGIFTYSKVQNVTMYKYCNFLIFNGFVSAFFASSLFTAVRNLVSGETDFANFVKTLKEGIMNSSVLFINTIIQKSCTGMGMLMLKPVPLLVNYLLKSIFPQKTRRQTEQAQYAPPFNFGAVFPDVLLVYIMVFNYTLIAPLILILGLIYFTLAYYAYKYEFLYASENKYESGGTYWEQASKVILYSLMAFQITTSINILIDQYKVSALAITPLWYFSWVYTGNIGQIFSKSCNCYPINIEENEYLDKFVNKLKEDRLKLLESWEEIIPKDDNDIINLSDLDFIDEKDILSSTYYKDPITANSSTTLILPSNFFKTMKFIKLEDKNNLFGYKDSNIP